MYHKVGKIYHFILNMMKNSKKFIGMLIEGAQEKKDELLISTLFDSVLKLEKEFVGNRWEMMLIPLLHIQNELYRLRYSDGVVEILSNRQD